MFPHTITIYHKDGASWLRSVVSGVLWNEIKGSTMRKTGVTSTDKIQIIIPSLDVTICDKDMVVKGECDIEIVSSTKELTNGHMVTNVDIKDFGGEMSHLEVTAR